MQVILLNKLLTRKKYKFLFDNVCLSRACQGKQSSPLKKSNQEHLPYFVNLSMGVKSIWKKA